VERGFFGRSVSDAETLESKIDEPRRRPFGIILQGGEAGQRRLTEVVLPSVDQPIKMCSRQIVCPDRGGQWLDDDMSADRTALKSGGDAFTPPLQTDLPEHWLADRFAHPGHLVIKRVERKQRFAALGRGEQRCLEAVVVVAANQSGDSRKPAGPGGTAFPSRRFPAN